MIAAKLVDPSVKVYVLPEAIVSVILAAEVKRRSPEVIVDRVKLPEVVERLLAPVPSIEKVEVESMS